MNTAKVYISEDESIGKRTTSSENIISRADFETAIAMAGFGRFNILLLLAALPAAMSCYFETSVISYVLPSAECDLKLTLIHKGVLNAITFAGMITSAVGWGYLSDKKGRKNLIIGGFLLEVLCIVGAATSQNIIQLMIFKFLGGFFCCGPFAILVTYLGEFHGHQYRTRVLLMIGIMLSCSGICLPMLAALILPNNWSISIFSNTYCTWQIFLALCATPNILSIFLFSLLPESPRFLMSHNRNEEALKVFQTIFSINRNQSKDKYPIKELINEENQQSQDLPVAGSLATITDNGTNSKTVKSFKGFKAMFHKPYLTLSLHLYLLSFCLSFGQNTMRLWLPQLFASFFEYEQLYGDATNICSILKFNVNKTHFVTNSNNSECVAIRSSAYENNIIIAIVGLIALSIASFVVNIVGQKRMQVFSLFCAGCCGVSLYWSSSSLTTLIITSIFTSMANISSTCTMGFTVNLFPTSLRAIIVSINMMFGRIGSITGNVLFPVFMTMGCIPPFLMIGSIMFAGCLLSALLPATKNTVLK